MTRPRKNSPESEQFLFNAWLHGETYKELASKTFSSRQLIRNIVLRFNPTPEQYAEHERNFRK
jgi:hypothetical protein